MSKIFIKTLLAFTAFIAYSHASGIIKNNVEKMKKLYNPPTKDLPQKEIKAKKIEVFGNLIYWTAKEAGADCWAEVITIKSNSLTNNIRPVDFDWTPGFKIGIGYKINHDSWNTKAYFTRFHTSGEDKVLGEPATVHSAYLGNFYVNNPDGLGLSGPSYQNANIDWKIRFNIFDWELGKRFWSEKPLSLNPFLGIKGGWIDQSIYTRWENPNLSGDKYFNVGYENLENNYWGIGPKAGLTSKWNLYNGQSIFYFLGDFSGALMWGHWSFYDFYQNDNSEKVSVGLKNINGASSMMQMFLGFGWEKSNNKNKYDFSIKLGYEMQFWLDQLQFYSFTGGRLVNMLTLQGGTFELYFKF